MELVKVPSGNEDFLELTALLDADLAERNGEEQKKYQQHNRVYQTMQVVVGYEDAKPIACGAVKPVDASTVELKRIFVKKEWRGRSFGEQIVKELEKAAKEAGYRCAVLETGRKQCEAVALYQKMGYTITENYPPYVGFENSVCMKKDL